MHVSFTARSRLLCRRHLRASAYERAAQGARANSSLSLARAKRSSAERNLQELRDCSMRLVDGRVGIGSAAKVALPSGKCSLKDPPVSA